MSTRQAMDHTKIFMLVKQAIAFDKHMDRSLTAEELKYLEKALRDDGRSNCQAISSRALQISCPVL